MCLVFVFQDAVVDVRLSDKRKKKSFMVNQQQVPRTSGLDAPIMELTGMAITNCYF